MREGAAVSFVAVSAVVIVLAVLLAAIKYAVTMGQGDPDTTAAPDPFEIIGFEHDKSGTCDVCRIKGVVATRDGGPYGCFCWEPF